MKKRLFSLSLVLGLMVIGGATANADQIVFGANSLGSIDISCTAGGPCTFSLNAPVGSTTVGSASFDSNNNTTISQGTYAFSGGPSSIANMQSSNGGLTFTASGSWLFSFSDAAGDSLSNATATWSYFSNVGPAGFNFGTLSLTGGTCNGVSAGFCSTVGNSTIDVYLEDMPTDLGSLYANGGSASDVMIEGGSVVPVPEPGTLALFGSGLIGIASFVRRKISRS
ncbi:MAG TPA: PEP-CTERM sorting domain-containing protein [Terriglobia bacterium]|nr:PEP-CTERM sorting domain-containing protein [Terriglobia bacterium]